MRGLPLILLLATGPALAEAPWFSEQAQAVGLDFRHVNGMSGQLWFVENVGGGVALFDYDNDGDLDVYLTQGQRLGQPPDPKLRDRLYRNDLGTGPDGRPLLRFTDVTEASGIRALGYGMGVAAGDYDNDGWIDLYLTNFGPNQLWRNLGDGRFKEVTAAAGAQEAGWSVSASFTDYDRDGWLDLFIGNYADYALDKDRKCYAPNSARDYCSPKMYPALPDRLLHNLGDGRFEDVSEAAGIRRGHGPALGVIGADLNGDARPDFYVANDAHPNQLWFNQGGGRFRDEALLAGVAVNMEGVAEASMGVDAGDFDGDGDLDLFMTHLLGETNTLYVNDGQGWFEDRSLATGLGVPSKGYTSFGTAWLDFDNDGWLDLFAANGEVRIVPILARAGDDYPLHQPNQLFRNLGDGRFQEVSAQAGPAFALSEVSRGAGFGDLDNDGDSDILVVNNNGPLRLLRNDIGAARPWLGLRLVSRQGRDALGALVEVKLDDGRSLWRRARSDGSYASANDPRVLVGLGQASVDWIQVQWPDGSRERFEGLEPGRYHSLRQGDGEKTDAR